MRSTVFVTASLIVHAICFTALAVNHFKQQGSELAGASEVEVAMGEGTLVADASGAAPLPEVKPLPEEPKKAVAKAKPKAKAKATKIVKTAPPKELPAKEKVAETELPENMDPIIDDAHTVAVPEEKISNNEDEKVELIPVKETVPAGVQAATSAEAEDKATEATSTEVNETQDPAPVTGEGAGVKGGETKGDAVSYLDLKQFSGNKPPVYPLSARKEQRHGQVDLLYRVTKDGRVAEVQVAKSSGHSDLDEAAVKAIAKYKFVPGQEGWARHPVIFALKGSATTLPSKLRGSSAAAE